MVYTPVSHPDAARLRDGAELGPVDGCAVTASFLTAVGSDTAGEEADFAALSLAGVLALRTPGRRRLVLAADVADHQVTDRRTAEGEVTVAELRWAEVQAVFADEPDAVEAVERARSSVPGTHTLSELLGSEPVAELLDSYDLLWFAPDELDVLT